MSAESPRHVRSGGPLTVPSQPPSDRSIIDAVSGFINDVTLSSSSNVDPKDVIQWARFETADINEPTPEGDGDNDISPLLLILGYGSGVQVWLITPNGDAQEVLSWRQGTVRVLRILPTPQHGDCFASKRPLIALCDSASPGPTFCSLSFISIRGGEQVKSIKFKNPILDVLANKRSVVVSFSERFAVFDAATLEDRMAITTCYPCPCPLGGSMPINPLALGDRWLAYADKKLNQSKRSSGGCEGEGVTSYTATVLHAAKSLSKGLRGLGETVAHSLSGGRSTSQSPSPPNADIQQPGVVTIVDIEGTDEEEGQDSEEPWDPMVAHFVAHSEAIIALKFDASGMLLVTADRRGHDFHVFRVNPHPCGPSLASVHHLYILHRGDTTAKVQDIAISLDSRWAAVSTLRGTTHVFAISPYGGACGVRTHTQPRVVNRLSRFHRSAGLPIHAHSTPKRPSGSPVGDGLSAGAWFPNPRLPPYPLPITTSPLSQLRPTANLPTHTITRTSSGRQRLSSLSEEGNNAPLLARARFGCAVGGATLARGAAAPVTALYLVTHTGTLLNILLHPRPLTGVPKEKVCDESPIELHVENVAQWALQRPPAAADLLAPLPPANPLLRPHSAAQKCADVYMSEEERWLSQVEIVTHAGPHRRLWMGPQFVFKTYNSTGSNSSLSEAETVEVESSAALGVARSNPVNMPGVRPVVPVLIDSGSASSVEHSPSDSFRRKSLLSESGRAASLCDVQLREDLAEAMKEDHGWLREESGERGEDRSVARAVDPLGCVGAARCVDPPPPLDSDAHTSANSDEATFRPVVRAPAVLPAEPLIRPLPRTTTIPVQPLPPTPAMPATPPPLPLDTRVLIPAEHATLNQPTEPERVSISTPPADGMNVTNDCEPCVPETKPAETVSKSRKDKISRKEKSTPISTHAEIDQTSVNIIKPIALEIDSYATLTQSLEDASKEADSSYTVKGDEIKVPASKSLTTRRPADYDKKTIEHPVSVSSESLTLIENAGNSSKDKISPAKSSRQDDRGDGSTGSSKATDKELTKTNVKNIILPSSRRLEKSDNSDVEKVSSSLTETLASSKTTDKALTKSDAKKTLPNSRRLSKSIKCPDVEIVYSSSTETELTSLKEKVDKLSKDRISPAKTSEKEHKIKHDCVNIHNEEIKIDVQKITLPLSRRATKVEKSIVDKEYSVSSLTENSPPELSVEQSEKISKDKKSPFRNSEKEDKVKEHFQVPLPAVRTSVQPWIHEEIKTEDQAWDMLLNEHEKPLHTSPSENIGDRLEDSKPKTRKNRKVRKTPDAVQGSVDEDSFVEIHAIDEKQQVSSGDLVSISSPFEDVDTCGSYVAKSRKTRSSKSLTPEKVTEVDQSSVNIKSKEECDLSCKLESNLTDIDILSELATASKSTQDTKSKTKGNTVIASKSIELDRERSNVNIESSKPRKTKSLSPYNDMRKIIEGGTTDVKDVYVIDSSKDEFPDIQITRGNKSRRKSPQSSDMVLDEKPLFVEKPVKSWSSIAASTNVKKADDIDINLDFDKKADKFENEIKYVDKIDVLRVSSEAHCSSEVNLESSKKVSLQEKLYELCKRRDIMVAECDTPTELNFVEEHHSDLHDLPPLEPLDFGLDDFKLEVMRDSLLDVDETKITSPICKINIDDILSSIKETTSRVIESSTFNLIDLEKVPARKEKGFSVIESHKITSQEVKIDDELKANEGEADIIEKSSDDDNTPIDSDKEDKKIGATKAVLPSAKQTTKVKKSRRKKK